MSTPSQSVRLGNYLGDRWIDGEGAGIPLINPANGNEVARAGGDGLDLAVALEHARRVGGPALRALSYGERAALLRAVADVLVANREAYYRVARDNGGNTERDAALDVDGGIGVLKYYAGLGRKLGDARALVEPDDVPLGKDGRFATAHLWTPVPGVAVHINAFNFPSWGLWEKAAVALLSGVPVFAKPAVATAWLAHLMVRDVIEAGCLPPGTLQLLCAGGRDLMDHVRSGDAVAFTGSADTARTLSAHPNVIAGGVRFNVEADSLNSVVLGPDVAPDSPEFDAFVRETVREMTVKAGQKCTAIRRILVPRERLDVVQDALTAKLQRTTVGDPAAEGVRMGPLVNHAQQTAAWSGLERLTAEAERVHGGTRDFPLVDADPNAGCFFPPTLLRCEAAAEADAVHQVEVFGPVATLIPYAGAGEVFDLAARGGGSLVASVFSADEAFAVDAALALGPHHGRVALVNGAVADANPGHGVVMPQSVHGGPGRAGGGEEMGGLRGLRFYHQRSAIQAGSEGLAALRARAAEVVL